MIKIQTTLPKEKRSSKKKKGKRIGFTVLLVLGIFLVFALAFGFWLYKTVMSPNVQTADGKDIELFIPTGTNYEQVKAILSDAHCITNEKSFNWVAQKKELPENVHPGHYVVKNGFNNNQLVNMLRGGLQTPPPSQTYCIIKTISDSWASTNTLFLPSSFPTPTSSIGTPTPRALSSVCSKNTTSSGPRNANNKPNPKA